MNGAPPVGSVRRRWKNHVIFALAMIAVTLARPLPAALLRAMGRLLGLLAWALLRSERRRAEASMAIGLGLDHQASRGRVRATFVSLGAMLGDTIALLSPRCRASARMPMEVPAQAVLAQALSHGKGVVLVTAHLGLWEHLAARLVEEGYRLVTPVRRSYDPRLERSVVGPLREARGVETLDRDAASTPRALLSALKSGAIVGVLLDLNTRASSAAVPFFGRPAWTPTIAARLALHTGAPLVTAFAFQGGIEVELVRAPCEPSRPASEASIVALTAELTARIEAAVRREPTRWIWMHDRWGAPRDSARARAVTSDKNASPAPTEMESTGESTAA